MKIFIAALAAAIVLAPMATGATMTSARTGAVKPFSVRLNAVGGSGESGWARFNRGMNSSTTVVNISVTGEPAGASQPVHIHTGSCAAPGAVTWGLTNVMGGASTTRLLKPLAWFKSAAFIIVMHRSNTQLGIYVSCGTHGAHM